MAGSDESDRRKRPSSNLQLGLIEQNLVQDVESRIGAVADCQDVQTWLVWGQNLLEDVLESGVQVTVWILVACCTSVFQPEERKDFGDGLPGMMLCFGSILYASPRIQSPGRWLQLTRLRFLLSCGE